MTTEDRLAAIEKANRKLKLSIVLMLVLFLLLASRGAMRGHFDEITAKKITVLGQFGETIVGIGAADSLKLEDGMSLDSGGAVVVSGKHGNIAAMMADLKTAGLVLASENPQRMVALSSNNDRGAPELSMTCPDAKAHLAVSAKTSGLQIVAGRARVSAGIASNAPMVAVDNGDNFDALAVGQ